MGLEAPGGSHLSTWTQTLPTGESVTLSNVIGVLPGTDAALQDSPIVLGAHYDHLGVETAADGSVSVFAGADDNASGVAIMLDVARHAGLLCSSPSPAKKQGCWARGTSLPTRQRRIPRNRCSPC